MNTTVHASVPTAPTPLLARAGTLLAALVLAALALQALSPLRLNYDSVLLLEMVENHLAGRGWNPDARSQHPLGYPALVAALWRLGLAGPVALVLLNVLTLAVGLWASDRAIAAAVPDLPGGVAARRLILLLTALSWVVVKHSALVVTDVVFFGVWGLSLLALERAWSAARPRALAWLAFAAALTLAAVLTRTVGIALLPALAWALIAGGGRAPALATTLRHRPVLLAALLLVGVLIAFSAALALTRTAYWAGFVKQYQGGSTIGVALTTARFRLDDLGQTLANVPESVVPALLRPGLALLGMVGYVLLALGLWRERRNLRPSHAAFIAYSAIILIWPFADPRFWIPVLPMAGALILSAFAGPRAHPLLARVGLAYALGFVILGIAAIALSTRLTLSGDRFPDRYGSGVYRDAYRAAMGLDHDRSRADPLVVRLLQRFDPRRFPGPRESPR